MTTWPPYTEGLALYSAKLYSRIAKYVHVDVVANKMGGKSAESHGALKVSVNRSWTRGSPISLLQIFNKIMQLKPNIVHIQYGWLLYGNPLTAFFLPFLVFFLRFSRRPVIVTLHTVVKRNAHLLGNPASNSVMNMTIFVITRSLVTLASRVVVHSTLMRKTLEEACNCPKNKIEVIPHGVDRAKRPIQRSAAFPFHNQPLNILSLGFLRESKGLETLFKAFRELYQKHPYARLIIVGSSHPHDRGDYAEKLRIMTDNLQSEGKILLLDFVEESSLDDFINDAEIIVLMSEETEFVESSGALARVADFEKPVICSRVPKFQSELVDGYDCIMVNPNNPVEISFALEVLIDDIDLRRRIALNLKKQFDDRYWDDVARRHIQLYQSFFSTPS